MICPLVPFPVTLSDHQPRFQGHGVIFRPMNALDVLFVQLTCDLFAIAKFLFIYCTQTECSCTPCPKNTPLDFAVTYLLFC